MLGRMKYDRTCCLCGARDVRTTAEVRSNVRRFAGRTFPLWRCGSCGSIHAAEPADLGEIYLGYPFQNQRADWALWCAQHTLLRRLRRAGVRPGTRVLDFGCGSGLLVSFLRRQGYRAEGFDPYSTAHADPAVLDEPFPAVLAQDVIEHDENPRAILECLDALLAPGGVAVLGTPHADAIDLGRPQRFVHQLHQPFHRHILSKRALLKLAGQLGWSLEKLYTTPYTNMPLLNLPLLHHFMKHADGTLDALFDRKPSLSFWLDPKTWWLLGTGYFLCNPADIQAIFRKKR